MNQKLKAKIIERFGSQWKFAHAAGLHEAQVSRFVRGRDCPGEAMRKRLCALLECDQDIFSSKEEMTC